MIFFSQYFYRNVRKNERTIGIEKEICGLQELHSLVQLYFCYCFVRKLFITSQFKDFEDKPPSCGRWLSVVALQGDSRHQSPVLKNVEEC